MSENRVKILILAGVTVLVVGLWVGWWSQGMGRKQGEEVKTTSGVPLELVGEELRKGEEVSWDLIMKTGEVPISGVSVALEVDERYVEIKEIAVNEETVGVTLKNEIGNGGKRLLMSGISMKPIDELPRGDVVLAKVKLVGKNSGKSYVVLLPETYATRASVTGEGDNQVGLNLVNKEVIVE